MKTLEARTTAQYLANLNRKLAAEARAANDDKEAARREEIAQKWDKEK